MRLCEKRLILRSSTMASLSLDAAEEFSIKVNCRNLFCENIFHSMKKDGGGGEGWKLLWCESVAGRKQTLCSPEF